MISGSVSVHACHGLHDLSCYGFIKVFESQLLTETFRGSAQARPKQAMHVTSVLHIWHIRAIPTYRVYRLYDYVGHAKLYTQ